SSSSSLTRMLALLDAFTPQRYAWTVDDLAEHFKLTPSSTYRYVKELCKAGLLIRLPRGVYVIGARIVELESLIRETDPVIKAGAPILHELAQETGCHVLLSNVYGEHLMNVAHVRGIEPLQLSYLRGRSLPWFRGAPAKSVLAYWPRARVRKLFESTFGSPVNEEEWTAIWTELKAIRKAGYSISDGGLDPDVIGFGVPIMLEDEVIGTISLVCSRNRAKFLNETAVSIGMKERSSELTRRLLNSCHE
ncbi:MAG TPA: helix-turn-helix domain-containing protein, partial [Eoetvoesiella sp.]